MTTQISADNIQTATLQSLSSGPTVTNIQITDSSYNVLDDTAIALTGGYIKITGTNFASGCTVIVNSTNATSTTFVNSTTINAQIGAMSAGTYVVYVVNTDGSVAIRVNGLTFSSEPAWVTGSTLPTGAADASISIQLDATSATTYTLQAGSSLPSGLSLSSGGLISGTVSISTETTYNFTIVATDAELQDSPRAFSITITAGDAYFEYNTLLIPGASTTFVDDASTNNFAVAIAGDTKPNSFNPYTPGYYSNYFDGTGDYLSVPASAALSFAADFTIECWVNTSTTSLDPYGRRLWSFGSGVAFYLDALFYDGSSTTPNICIEIASVGIIISGTIAVADGRWHHVALSRSGSSMKLFVDGVQSGSTYTTSSTFTAGATNGMFLGCQGAGVGGFLLGNISNFRVNNTTGLYTTTFTPSTTPLTAVSGTGLLTCQSNRFIDNSTNALAITVNGNTTVNSFNPFIPNSSYATYGSGYFDGSGDYLTAPSSSAFTFGTGDFTIEGWVYVTAHNGAGANGIFQQGTTAFPSSTTNTVSFGTVSSGQVWQIYAKNTNTNSSATWAFNTWYHFAVVRSSGTTKLYINGVSVITVASDTTNYTGTYFGIGSIYGTGYSQLGYISDVRVVNGTAVYTTTFTPPSAPLTAIANTSLLTLQNNQSVNNNVFIENSTNNFLVTRSSTPAQGTFSPYGGNWSNYFGNANGNGLYLSAQSSGTGGVALDGNYTIEMWLYPTGASGSGYSMLTATNTNGGYFQYYYNSSGNIGYYTPGYGQLTTSSAPLTFNTWQHVALVRSSNVVKVYVNGVEKAFSSVITDSSTVYVNYIGGLGSVYNTFGNISNLRVLKGTALYTNTFTPPTGPLTPITNTALLTCQSNRFEDNSINNYTINLVGAPTVQRFSPFNPSSVTPTSYSAYFDGSGDYLSVPSSANLAFGTGDFCVEMWYYQTASAGVGLFSNSISSGSGGDAQFEIQLDSVNLYPVLAGWASVFLTSSVASPLNSWNHLVVCRSGTTASMFLNGTRVATATVSNNFSSTNAFNIGRQASNSGYLTGYISNLRAVKGSSVYNPASTTITVPTTPLTAVSNTSLLTCQSTTFIDNSTNNFTITANGDTKLSTQNPFGFTSATTNGYSTSTIGGSAYFDRSVGQYLTLPDSTFWALGTTATIELWYYPVQSPDISRLISIPGVASGAAIDIYDSAGNIGAFNQGYGPAIKPHQWIHIAVVLISGTWYLYYNGVKQTVTGGNTGCNITSTGALWVGAISGYGQYTGGYISDLRITKGVAVYNSNFVPPTAPLAPIQNTVALLNMTGAGIYDAAMMNDMVTVGDAKLSTSVTKFGGSSMYFDGTTDYAVQATNTNFGYGTGDFTIEFWLYLNTVSADQTIVSHLSSTSSVNPHIYYSNGTTLRYYTNSADRITGSSLSINTWYHIAVCRASGSTKMFINGTQSGSTYTDSNNYGTTAPLGIGTYWSAGSPVTTSTLNGYLDDLRITKGYARYTANFTAPTSAFQIK